MGYANQPRDHGNAEQTQCLRWWRSRVGGDTDTVVIAGSEVLIMSGNRVKVGIVGLGRWAKVLTRAARTSDALEIVSGFSRSEESRAAFQSEFGVKSVADLASLLADPAIKGVILAVPNEQH